MISWLSSACQIFMFRSSKAKMLNISNKLIYAQTFSYEFFKNISSVKPMNISLYPEMPQSTVTGFLMCLVQETSFGKLLKKIKIVSLKNSVCKSFPADGRESLEYLSFI